jgi:hypothetical protein
MSGETIGPGSAPLPDGRAETSEKLATELAEIRRLLAAQAEEIIRLRLDLEAARRPWWRRGLGGS